MGIIDLGYVGKLPVLITNSGYADATCSAAGDAKRLWKPKWRKPSIPKGAPSGCESPEVLLTDLGYVIETARYVGGVGMASMSELEAGEIDESVISEAPSVFDGQ